MSTLLLRFVDRSSATLPSSMGLNSERRRRYTRQISFIFILYTYVELYIFYI